MKKIIAFLLAASLMVATAGCSVKTKSNVDGSAQSGTTNTVKAKPNGIEINLLSMSANEKDANILRDQFTKAGFTVKLNIQPDYSSFMAQQDAGNYDLSVTGWTSVTGNPDYAVRSLFKSDGDYNDAPINDPELDALIAKASTETPEEYAVTYKELEEKLVTENAYTIPLYSNIKSQAYNHDILKPESVRLSKSRSMVWEELDFVDESKRATQPLVLSQALSTLTSLDPIKGNDGSINTINTQMYVRLVNLTDDDTVVSDGSLSYNHAIADGNTEYYFVLRDDIKFAKVENKKAVTANEIVGAEDVVFSLERANNAKSVPDHKTYTLHESINKVEIVSDLETLTNIKVSGSEQTMKDALQTNLKTPITQLVTDKTKVDNASGNYQVVKITTTTPFPQVLNYLAHQSAGIVSKKQIEAINTYDVATYDRNKDIAYGDQSTITQGTTYNNQLVASGPYILIEKNDYEATFQKNPAYMVGTQFEPKIENVTIKFIKDADSSLSALRSGETHILYSVPENKFNVVTSDAKLTLMETGSNSVSYLLVNMAPDKKTANADLRKALLYAVNQEEFIAVYEGKKNKAFSTLSTMVDTGNIHTADIAKSIEFADKYLATTK